MIKLIMVMSLILGLETAQVDIMDAFLHILHIKGEDIYVEIAQGFRQEGKFYKIKGYQYSRCQISINFLH